VSKCIKIFPEIVCDKKSENKILFFYQKNIDIGVIFRYNNRKMDFLCIVEVNNGRE